MAPPCMFKRSISFSEDREVPPGSPRRRTTAAQFNAARPRHVLKSSASFSEERPPRPAPASRRLLRSSVSFSEDVTTHDIPSIEKAERLDVFYSRKELKSFKTAAKVRTQKKIDKIMKAMNDREAETAPKDETVAGQQNQQYLHTSLPGWEKAKTEHYSKVKDNELEACCAAPVETVEQKVVKDEPCGAKTTTPAIKEKDSIAIVTSRLLPKSRDYPSRLPNLAIAT